MMRLKAIEIDSVTETIKEIEIFPDSKRPEVSLRRLIQAEDVKYLHHALFGDRIYASVGGHLSNEKGFVFYESATFWGKAIVLGWDETEERARDIQTALREIKIAVRFINGEESNRAKARYLKRPSLNIETNKSNR